MPIPDYQSLMLPVLRLAGDRKEHSLAEFRQRIAAEFNLSEDELVECLASDSETVFANRIDWAVQGARMGNVR
jgi:restriction system protein